MSVSASSVPRIDAHHHVWRLDRGDYGWLTPTLAAIYRDFSLDDLSPLLDRIEIKATVLVQAAPTVAETEFLLQVAHASDGLVKGVVGWVDLAAPQATATLERLARDSLLKSIRPMLQDIADPAWILRRDVDVQLTVIEKLGLRFDALVKPPQLAALLQMVERHPRLPVVIDHGGKPAIIDRDWEPWASEIAELADHPHVACKLPERLLWGSDWPVVNLAGGYHRWARASDQLLARLPAADRNAIFGDNAQRFYGL